jgi:hypothetical protein
MVRFFAVVRPIRVKFGIQSVKITPNVFPSLFLDSQLLHSLSCMRCSDLWHMELLNQKWLKVLCWWPTIWDSRYVFNWRDRQTDYNQILDISIPCKLFYFRKKPFRFTVIPSRSTDSDRNFWEVVLIGASEFLSKVPIGIGAYKRDEGRVESQDYPGYHSIIGIIIGESRLS